jgi:transglutaminase-like putative cysteine protease
VQQRQWWATDWRGKIARVDGTPHANATIDDCFWWIFHPMHRWFSSGISQAVRDRVPTAATPATAVSSALLEREDVRAREATLVRWCRQGQRLYRPDQVRPFLAPHRVASDARGALHSLASWVTDRVEYMLDENKWGRPDLWQAPAMTLRDGTGDCEDSSLLLWSAAPLLGLPRGRMVVGLLGREGHAWVEFPELGLWVETTNGHVGPLVRAGEPGAYRPWLYLYADGSCEDTGIDA